MAALVVGLVSLLVTLVVHVGEHVVVLCGGAKGRGGWRDIMGIAGLVMARAGRLVKSVVMILVVQGTPIVVHNCWFC